MDNNYVEGSNLPITGKDDLENTYQTRTLENDTTHKVLKNFPAEIFIQKLLTGRAADINFYQLAVLLDLKYKNI